MKRLSILQSVSGLASLLIVLECLSHSSAQTLDFTSTTCASMTVVNGVALSIITAGNRASYTITARDAASISRSAGGDAFVLSLREDFDRPLEQFLDAWNGEIICPHRNLVVLFPSYRSTVPVLASPSCFILILGRLVHSQRACHACRIL